MAYATKYRGTFKDELGVTVQADIQQDGYSGSVTDVEVTANPLTITWEGDRDDIFNPVRGAYAEFNFYASTDGQFNEFFDANNKEYKLVISAGGVYWSGWLMLSDYQEALIGAPYEVSVRAYDLGYLREYTWDVSNTDTDDILSVLLTLLNKTDLDLSVNERVDIFEDSLSSSSSGDGMLDEIDIKERLLIDDSWVGITYYEALSRILRPFNAFVVQEGNAWNICRVPAMRDSHFFRFYNSSGVLGFSSTEDTTSPLSDYYQRDRNTILMSGKNYNTIEIIKDYGIKDLVDNSVCNRDADIDDYWANSGTGTIVSLDYDSYQNDWESSGGSDRGVISKSSIELVNGLLTGIPKQTTLTHNTTYKADADTQVRLEYDYKLFTPTPPASAVIKASEVRIQVILTETASPFVVRYLDLSDGSWSSLATASEISFSPFESNVSGSGSIMSDNIPNDGTLSIKILGPDWRVTGGSSENGYSYFNISVTPIIINNSDLFQTKEIGRQIDADSFDNYSQTFYLGDAQVSAINDLTFGALYLTGTTTNSTAWQSQGGSRKDNLLEICTDCYEAQYSTPAKRIQAVLKGDLDYLTVLTYDGAEYLASSVTRDFRTSEWDGEWIEIQEAYSDDLVTSYTNINYQNYATSGDTVNFVKTLGFAQSGYIDTPTITIGQKYLITVIWSALTGDAPSFGESGNSVQLSGTDESFYFTPTGTTDLKLLSDSTDVVNGTVQIKIQEVLGL